MCSPVWQAVAGVAADGRQAVNRSIAEAQNYKRCKPAPDGGLKQLEVAYNDVAHL